MGRQVRCEFGGQLRNTCPSGGASLLPDCYEPIPPI